MLFGNDGVLFGNDGVLLAGNDRGSGAYAGRGPSKLRVNKPRPYEESGVISSVGQDAGRTVNRGCYK